MKKYLVLISLIMLVSFGCKQRMVTQPDAQMPPGEREKKEAVSPATEKVTDDKMASRVESIGEKEMAALTKEEGLFADILFDFDKYNVKDQYKTALKEIAAWMTKNPQARLSIEGHCDERGTNEYNLALGDRRAKAVEDYLVSLGVPSTRVETISYGEEKPLCSEPSEDCWAKNRRAHFVIVRKAGN